MGSCISFMRFYFIFVFLFTFVFCRHENNVPNNSTIKSMIVHEIMRKVSNLSLSALSNVPNEKKETVLKKIENKLRQSARSMGPNADKYVKFILEEFKTKAFNGKEKKNDEEILRKSTKEKSGIRSKKPQDVDPTTKQEIIRAIATKIETLAKVFMKGARTIESKKKILEKIKDKILDSAKQKHKQLHTKHEELKTYSSLISRGLEESMRKMLGDEIGGRRSRSKLFPTTKTTGNLLERSKNISESEEDLAKKTKVIMDIEEISKYKNLISQSLNDTYSLDTVPNCDKIVEDTCRKIQIINKVPCGKGKTTSIENLCNGVVDCVNKIDEVNCTAQAIERVRTATSIMSEIEASLSRQCFASTNGHLLSAQNQILRDVLESQKDFLEKHFKSTMLAVEDKDGIINDVFLKKTMSDVTMILITLSYALDGALCARNVDPDHLGATSMRRINDIEIDEVEEGPQALNWTPKLCRCKGSFCKDTTCEAPCKRICWQRYSLNHWGCQALNSAPSVSLDVLCDGKLDCFDETDENSCATDDNYSKFEASKTYSNLLDLLAAKSVSHEFQECRNKLVTIHGLVRQLQKQTIRSHDADSHVIKTLRDEAFSQLVSIYDDLLQTASLEELDDHYLTLLAINEKLASALKRSHTGNEHFISPDGCYCRGGLCALRRCNKYCIQACLAEPVLTRYACTKDDDNVTVSIESICNGNNDCPNGEDEKDCVKDVCRGHHLVLLRHNLQNVGAKHKASIMGEVIESWKAKVSAALFIAESTERPNHKAMVDIISRVLRDLVMAFAAMEDYRKSHSEYALKEFKSISKIVMRTLKSCTY